MAKTFAGILGPLAFLTVLARGALHGAEINDLAWTAWIALVLFSAVGAMLGGIAGWTIQQSVQMQVAARKDEARPASGKTAAG